MKFYSELATEIENDRGEKYNKTVGYEQHLCSADIRFAVDVLHSRPDTGCMMGEGLLQEDKGERT